MGTGDDVLKHLEEADWVKIITELARYAHWRAYRYKWRSGNPGQLPDGKTPKDIAFEAISKVITGDRAWDPDRYPDLLIHLKWIVKSDLNHLFTSMGHMSSGRLNESIEHDSPESPYDETILDPRLPLCDHTQTPEEHLIAKENAEYEEMAKQKLFALVKGDEDLESLLLCFDEGIDKPELIAREMGWDIKTVYSLKRKLLRKASSISKIMQNL